VRTLSVQDIDVAINLPGSVGPARRRYNKVRRSNPVAKENLRQEQKLDAEAMLDVISFQCCDRSCCTQVTFAQIQELREGVYRGADIMQQRTKLLAVLRTMMTASGSFAYVLGGVAICDYAQQIPRPSAAALPQVPSGEVRRARLPAGIQRARAQCCGSSGSKFAG